MLVWNCYLLSNHGSCPPPTPSGSLTFPQAPQAHATVSGEEKQLDLWDPSPSCHLLWGKEGIWLFYCLLSDCMLFRIPKDDATVGWINDLSELQAVYK